MSQTVRLTITSDIEKALEVLNRSTFGTLNTTELIKFAIGELARIKEEARRFRLLCLYRAEAGRMRP